jgi:hypothetical protein
MGRGASAFPPPCRGDRAFKLRFRWTPEYGGYVKYPYGAPQRVVTIVLGYFVRGGAVYRDGEGWATSGDGPFDLVASPAAFSIDVLPTAVILEGSKA